MSPDPHACLLARFGFGHGENGVALLGPGWSAPEPRFTWSDGAASQLALTAAPVEGDLFLRLVVQPFTADPTLPAQRMRLSINGTAQPEEVLRDIVPLGFQLNGAAWRSGGDVHLWFEFPDSDSPRARGAGADTRRLGIALLEMQLWRVPKAAPVERCLRPPLPTGAFDFSEAATAALRGLTALSVEALMLACESIGHNCEFGLMQRRCGAESQGLLRFVGITPERLIAGLDCSFEGVDDPALLDIVIEGDERPEYLLLNKRYGMQTHSFRYPDETDEASIRDDQIRRLSLQRRRLLELLASGEKLFVYHDFGASSLARGRAVLQALRRHGPNALLLVTTGGAHPAGSVELIERDFYLGYLDAFAPVWAADRGDLSGWITVCGNAYRLWREQGLGTGAM